MVLKVLLKSLRDVDTLSARSKNNELVEKPVWALVPAQKKKR